MASSRPRPLTAAELVRLAALIRRAKAAARLAAGKAVTR